MSTTSSPTQKQVERWQLQRFMDLLGSFPEGDVLEHEEPDFLVRLEDRVIGIELTDLYWESPKGVVPQQAIESDRARIAKLAGIQYESKGLPNLHASIHFDPNYIPKKADVARLSTVIANLIMANVPQPEVPYREDYDWENRAYFPEEVHHVSAWRLPGLDRSFFTSSGAAFIPDMERKDIERALALKQQKLQRYRLSCNEIWLVINCDGAPLSTVFDIDDSVLEKSFYSGFDRVFLFRHMAMKIHELLLHNTDT